MDRSQKNSGVVSTVLVSSKAKSNRLASKLYGVKEHSMGGKADQRAVVKRDESVACRLRYEEKRI